MGIIMLVLCVGALVIAIWSSTRPAPILWISVVLLSIAMMLVAVKDAGFMGNFH
jgi:threonine/homoserine efflux transporter RhtA